MTLARIVKDALERGWSIIPIGKNKKPIIDAWKPFQKTPATKGTVEDWAGWGDRAGWSVITGAVSGIVIIDFDGKDGLAHLEAWGMRPHVRTPSGGFHVYARHPGWHVKTFNAKSLRNPEFKGIDIRGDGGYGNFDGRVDGGAYKILRSFDLVDPKDIPEPLRKYAGLDAPPAPDATDAERAEALKAAKKRPHLVKPDKEPRRIDTYKLIDRAVGMLGNCGRNDAGFWLAIQIRDNGYSESEAEGVLLDYQRRVPDTDTKGKRASYSQAEALASVRSAYSQSPREPWAQAPGAPPWVAATAATEQAPPPPPETGNGESADEDDSAPAPNRVGRSILAEAAYLSTHGEQPLWKFDGVLWQRSSNSELLHEAAMRDGRRTSRRRRNEIASYIRAICFRRKIEWNEGIRVNEIPVQNGVLDLATMEIRPHESGNLADWAAPFAYLPELKCPLWLETLETLFVRPSDEESDADETAAIRDAERIKDARDRIATLQEYAGYCLMRPLPRFALIIKGVPDTGKSLLLNMLRKIVGEDFCCGVSWEDVSDPRKLAPIAGMRLNALPEVSERSFISDRGFNALLGGDRLPVDRKFEDPEMIQPMARHVILCNELPMIRNYSGAVYKRLLAIEMPRKLSIAEQDKQRDEKLMPELPAIMAWAIEGARRLWVAGFRFTWAASSRKLMHEYRRDENPMFEFITAYCTVDPDQMVPRESLFNAYRIWSGRKDVADGELRRMLKAAGFRISEDPVYYKSWGKTVRCVEGLTLSAGVPDPTFKS